MKGLIAMMIVAAFLALGQTGCSGRFLGGAAAGAVGTGAAYEISAKRQMDRLEEDYKAGRITKQEYEVRKDQIRKGSIIY